MTRRKITWLALSLLGSVSAAFAITAVVSMTTDSWRAPASAEAMPDQSVAQIEPVADTQIKPATMTTSTASTTVSWPDMSPREAANPEPPPAFRGAELAADPAPAATMAPMTGRRGHDAKAKNRMAMANVQQPPIDAAPIANAPPIKKLPKDVKDAKAEMRAKQAKSATTMRTCPPTTPWADFLQKLNLASSTGRCPS